MHLCGRSFVFFKHLPKAAHSKKKRNEKRRTCKSKKRFGKSISEKAPKDFYSGKNFSQYVTIYIKPFECL